jgi:hypothetical protein
MEWKISNNRHVSPGALTPYLNWGRSRSPVEIKGSNRVPLGCSNTIVISSLPVKTAYVGIFCCYAKGFRKLWIMNYEWSGNWTLNMKWWMVNNKHGPNIGFTETRGDPDIGSFNRGRAPCLSALFSSLLESLSVHRRRQEEVFNKLIITCLTDFI